MISRMMIMARTTLSTIHTTIQNTIAYKTQWCYRIYTILNTHSRCLSWYWIGYEEALWFSHPIGKIIIYFDTQCDTIYNNNKKVRNDGNECTHTHTHNTKSRWKESTYLFFLNVAGSDYTICIIRIYSGIHKYIE